MILCAVCGCVCVCACVCVRACVGGLCPPRVVLVAEGLGQPIQKGYIYFAMAFSFSVEMLNLKIRGKRLKAAAAASS